jgi:hypothetical protein
MSEKVIPIFDGTGEAYWWLIQLDRYFKINSWIRENMKVDWVTVFALKGEAYRWWSSWKQVNPNEYCELMNYDKDVYNQFQPGAIRIVYWIQKM